MRMWKRFCTAVDEPFSCNTDGMWSGGAGGWKGGGWGKGWERGDYKSEQSGEKGMKWVGVGGYNKIKLKKWGGGGGGLLLNPRKPGGMKQIKVLLLHRSWYNIHYSIQSTHMEIFAYLYIFCLQDNLGLCLVIPLKLINKPFVQQNCTRVPVPLFPSISTTQKSMSYITTANRLTSHGDSAVLCYLLLMFYTALFTDSLCSCNMWFCMSDYSLVLVELYSAF